MSWHPEIGKCCEDCGGTAPGPCTVWLDQAVAALRVWFFEMATDYAEGTYDCTCADDDLCPLHRVAGLLGWRRDGAEFVDKKGARI